MIYADMTYQIRKAVFTVYNSLGFGHKEEVYQKALEKEFSLLPIPYKREVPLRVLYRGELVGSYRPDFVIADKIILEIKAVNFMPKEFEAQLIHYLKSTGFQLGLLVNFGSPKLIIKRFVWTGNPRKSKISGNPIIISVDHIYDI